MHKLSQWGAIVIPASPGFYNHPKTIDDMVDFVVARILDHIGLDHNVGTRWTGEEIP
jgi:4-hydroxy-3-polyprenylbenzoate decarboxylase